MATMPSHWTRAPARVTLAVAFILAVAGCGGGSSSKDTQSTETVAGSTPQQAYTQIRACLLKAGAFVKPSGDVGGGFAFWGADHTLSGRWGSWSYATRDDTGEVLTVTTAKGALKPTESSAFDKCTAWPEGDS
jgi:hypothetical protein